MKRSYWLAWMFVLCLAIAGSVGSLAQDDGGNGGGPGGGGPGGGGMGGPGGGMGGRGRMGMGMGGSAALVAHKDHLFVLMGARLIKIDPDTMKIVSELDLGASMGAPGGMGGPGGAGGPGGGGFGGGGGK